MKVGDTAEVIEITDNSHYPRLYDRGATGVIRDMFYNGNCMAILGKGIMGDSTWHVYRNTYKKVGKLTVTKVK